MLNPRALTHAQLAEIVADVQAILGQESRMLPDFPREYGQHWNPAKEWLIGVRQIVAVAAK